MIWQWLVPFFILGSQVTVGTGGGNEGADGLPLRPVPKCGATSHPVTGALGVIGLSGRAY